MDEITYTCTRCRRPITAPRVRVLNVLATGKLRCQVCGSLLEFPADIVAEFETLSKTPGAAPYARPADAECPVCARAVRGNAAAPESILRCLFCGTQMRLPIDERGTRLPPSEGPASDPGNVERELLYMPNDELGGISREALLARAARGEVVPGEAEALSRAHAALARWRPEEHDGPFLPLDEDEAATVIPVILFRGQLMRREAAEERTELILHVGTTLEPSDFAKASLTINLLGMAAMFALGSGLFVHSHGGSQEALPIFLRVSLDRVSGGVTLGLSHQIEDRPPVPAGEQGLAAMRAQIIDAAPRLRGYYALLAIFGSWVEGSRTLQVVPKALERRLTSLGSPLAERAVQIAANWKPLASRSP
jgi:DNA-directed RNA polymerase subunit RPC12/RpoP